MVSSILEFWRCCGIAGSERKINSMRKPPSSALLIVVYLTLKILNLIPNMTQIVRCIGHTTGGIALKFSPHHAVHTGIRICILEYNCMHACHMSEISVRFHVNRPLLWSQKIAIGIDVTSDTAIFSKRRKIDTFCRYHSRMIDMSTSNVGTPISKNCPCCGIVENAIPTGTSSG